MCEMLWKANRKQDVLRVQGACLRLYHEAHPWIILGHTPLADKCSHLLAARCRISSPLLCRLLLLPLLRQRCPLLAVA